MIEYLRFVPVIKNIVSWLQTHPLGLVTLGFGHCKPHERNCQKKMLEERACKAGGGRDLLLFAVSARTPGHHR